MINPPASYNPSKFKNKPRLQRLAIEHQEIFELSQYSDLFTYEITKRLGSGFPGETYLITFRVKSIVGVDTNMNPVFGDFHQVQINYPADFPNAGSEEEVTVMTPLYHPNVKHGGQFDGKMCITKEQLGPQYSLADLIIRIGEILQFKNYLAQEVPPYPQDSNVAKWVREYAEPRGYVGKNQPVDNRKLIKPKEGFEPRPLPGRTNTIPTTPPPIPNPISPVTPTTRPVGPPPPPPRPGMPAQTQPISIKIKARPAPGKPSQDDPTRSVNRPITPPGGGITIKPRKK